MTYSIKNTSFGVELKISILAAISLTASCSIISGMESEFKKICTSNQLKILNQDKSQNKVNGIDEGFYFSLKNESTIVKERLAYNLYGLSIPFAKSTKYIEIDLDDSVYLTAKKIYDLDIEKNKYAKITRHDNAECQNVDIIQSFNRAKDFKKCFNIISTNEKPSNTIEFREYIIKQSGYSSIRRKEFFINGSLYDNGITYLIRREAIRTPQFNNPTVTCKDSDSKN